MKTALQTTSEHHIEVIDQTKLPFTTAVVTLRTANEVARAISSMVVRGAPLIGIAGAYGLALSLKSAPLELDAAFNLLLKTRPTAVNLRWALEAVRDEVKQLEGPRRFERAWEKAAQLHRAEVAACRRIAEHGLELFKPLTKKPLNVLTHCNAGWLATGEWGTALAPIYLAHESGLPVHVWVDETRPRNQGSLTAWELRAKGVPHTVIVDNAGGLLMQRGHVDACIVGADRVAANGDVCNKVGTYLKALAAKDNDVPFYVAAPLSTIDRAMPSGADIEVEERSGAEVRELNGATLFGAKTQVKNPAFDVTPAKLVSAIITEVGTASATAEGLKNLFQRGTT